MTPILKRVALVAGIAAILGALYSSGFFGLITDADRARAALEELGIWAPILYVVAFALLEPFFIPGLAFMIPGSVVFTFPELFAFSWLGSIGAGIVRTMHSPDSLLIGIKFGKTRSKPVYHCICVGRNRDENPFNHTCAAGPSRRAQFPESD